jgi:ABC-type transport system involved in multi-copper enzyme maturation permease subunit
VNLPTIVRTIRWMAIDTFRQAIASKLFYVMIAIVAVGTLLCLSVSVKGGLKNKQSDLGTEGFIPASEVDKIGKEKVAQEGVGVLDGKLSLGFGTFEVPIPRGRADIIKQLQVWLSAFVADTVGVLFAIIWTAGFLPTFLEPHSAAVMLAKPAPRWSILLGKYLGVILFVASQAILFVGCTWFALGIKTNVWEMNYWLAVPLLIANFGVFYAVSTFLAVWTRSTVAAAFGTILFWAICWMMNFAHHRMIMNGVAGMTPLSNFFMETGYWFMPKPFDMGNLFFDAMHAEVFAVRPEEMKVLVEKGRYHPELAVAANGAFAVGTLALAAYEFEKLDY